MLRSFQTIPTDFCVGVRALVGAAGGDGEESFDIEVCSPQWLAATEAEKGFLWPRGYLILWRWDYGLLFRAPSDLCRRAEGATWEEVARKLSGFAYWEFDNYSES